MIDAGYSPPGSFIFCSGCHILINSEYHFVFQLLGTINFFYNTVHAALVKSGTFTYN